MNAANVLLVSMRPRDDDDAWLKGAIEGALITKIEGEAAKNTARLAALTADLAALTADLTRLANPRPSQALHAAYEAAKRNNDPLTKVLETALHCAYVERPLAMQMLAEAARRADKLHDGLHALGQLDIHAEVKRRISSVGPPRGEAADVLATQLAVWLEDFNPSLRSSAFYEQYEEGTYTDDTDRDLVRAKFPKRLISKTGRVFVTKKGCPPEKSPRQGAELCRCMDCAAKHLMEAAERAMGMTFPKRRKKRTTKEK